jgi:5-methylcytosine-specific restriction protein A
VALKLSNFLAFDPSYKGKGMRGGSKLDGIVFKEFYKNRDRLHSIANEIKKASMIVEIKDKIYTVEDDEQTLADSVIEGQVLYKLHKVRERDIEIVRAKKNQVKDKEGKLNCEACVFEFEEFYGDIGSGYIECHHRTPLHTLKVEAKTTLADLALVCSNCHRMLHRSAQFLSVEDLRMRIRYVR